MVMQSVTWVDHMCQRHVFGKGNLSRSNSIMNDDRKPFKPPSNMKKWFEPAFCFQRAYGVLYSVVTASYLLGAIRS